MKKCNLCKKEIRPGANVHRVEAGSMTNEEFESKQKEGDIYHSTCFHKSFASQSQVLAEIKKISEQRTPKDK